MESRLYNSMDAQLINVPGRERSKATNGHLFDEIQRFDLLFKFDSVQLLLFPAQVLSI